MKKAIYVISLWILLLGPAVSIAFAKGPADKITISGLGWSEPVEITKAQILEKFSPWSEEFFDKRQGALEESPKVESTYQVLFYLKDESGELRASYAFEYAPGNPGYIHLPGKGDPWYETNKGIILREEDGRWLYASADWYDLMQDLLDKHAISDTGNSLRSDEAKQTADTRSDSENILSSARRFVGAVGAWPVIGLGIGIVIMLAAVLFRTLSHSSN